MAKNKDKKKGKGKGSDEPIETVTPVARVGYVQRPGDKDADGKEVEKYNVKLIFDNDRDIEPIIKMAQDALKAEFGVKKFGDSYGNPVHNGNKAFKKNKRKEYKDTMYISAKTGFSPFSITAKGKKADPDDKKFLYSGSYFQAIISPYTYNSSGNKGVAFNLVSLEKVEDGKPLGGGGISPERAKELFDKNKDGKAPGKKGGKDKKPKDKKKGKKKK